MSFKKILKLGDSRLYKVSVAVEPSELESLETDIEILHEALMKFRALYGAGRAVAAPQIGVLKRFIYLNINKPICFDQPGLI
ncbi:MAG: hypothetical protein GY834_05715 [Bacteroidetes bacterium]|nr:hypothetical protein [Bacteroidota bacterium]